MKLIKENLNAETTFQKLFKDVALAQEINNFAGINQRVVVRFFDDPNGYGNDFADYRAFKQFVLEEYNNARDILNAKFIIGEKFKIPYFGEDFYYIVELAIE